MTALSVLLATVAAVALSATYYALAPAPAPTTGGAPGPSPSAPVQAVTELVRSGAVAALVAGLMSAAGWAGAGQGLLLGLSLWTLPVVLLLGSVVHEGTPSRAAALHAGDWLLKLLVVGLLVGLLG